ncbi:MAG: porin family protein [Vicinamibacteria bacterium]
MRKLILVPFLFFLLAYTSRADAKGEASFMIGKTYVDELLLKDKASFGATIGVFSKIVGFELGFDYMPTSDFNLPGVDLGASVLNLAGNVVLQAPIGQFYPYGTLGYGAFFANASGDLATDEFLGTFGAFNYGLGVKLFFTDNVGVRVDYRRFAIQTDADDPDLVIPIVGDEISAEPDIDRFMIGVALRW